MTAGDEAVNGVWDSSRFRALRFLVMEGPEPVTDYLRGVNGHLNELQSSGEGCSPCRKSTRCLIPPVYRKELLQLVKLAGPVVRSAYGFLLEHYAGPQNKPHFKLNISPSTLRYTDNPQLI